MSFPKAKTKRFNDVQGCAPPPGSYNPNFPILGTSGKGHSFIKSERFVDPIFKTPVSFHADTTVRSASLTHLAFKTSLHKSVPNLETIFKAQDFRMDNTQQCRSALMKIAQLHEQIGKLEMKLRIVTKERDELKGGVESVTESSNNLLPETMIISDRTVDSENSLCTLCSQCAFVTSTPRPESSSTDVDDLNVKLSVIEMKKLLAEASVTTNVLEQFEEKVGSSVTTLKEKLLNMETRLIHAENVQKTGMISRELYESESKDYEERIQLLANENKLLSDKVHHDYSVMINALRSKEEAEMLYTHEKKLMEEHEKHSQMEFDAFKMGTDKVMKNVTEQLRNVLEDKSHLEDKVASSKAEVDLLQNTIEEYEKQTIVSLQSEISELKETNTVVTNNLNHTVDTLATRDIELNTMEHEYEKLQADINLLTINVGVLEQKKTSLEADLQGYIENNQEMKIQLAEYKGKLGATLEENEEITEKIEWFSDSINEVSRQHFELHAQYEIMETNLNTQIQEMYDTIEKTLLERDQLVEKLANVGKEEDKELVKKQDEMTLELAELHEEIIIGQETIEDMHHLVENIEAEKILLTANVANLEKELSLSRAEKEILAGTVKVLEIKLESMTALKASLFLNLETVNKESASKSDEITRIEGDIAELCNNLEHATEDCIKRDTKIFELESDINQMQLLICTFDEQKLCLDEKIQSLEIHYTDVADDLKSQKETSESTSKEKDELSVALEAAKLTISEVTSKHQQSLSELEEQINEQMSTIDIITKKLAVSTEDQESQTEPIEIYESLVSQLQCKVEEKNVLIEQIEFEHEQCCLNLHTEKEDMRKMILAQRNTLDTSEKDRIVLHDRWTALRKESTDLTKVIETFKNSQIEQQAQMEGQTVTTNLLQKRVKDLESGLVNLTAERDLWKQAELSYREQISAKNDELDVAQTEMESAQQKLCILKESAVKLNEKTVEVQNLNLKNEQLLQNLQELQHDLEKKQSVISSLEDVLEPFEDTLDALSKVQVEKTTLAQQVSHLIGHQNPHQKIKYLEKVLDEKSKLEEENRQYIRENTSLKNQLHKAKEDVRMKTSSKSSLKKNSSTSILNKENTHAGPSNIQAEVSPAVQSQTSETTKE